MGKCWVTRWRVLRAKVALSVLSVWICVLLVFFAGRQTSVSSWRIVSTWYGGGLEDSRLVVRQECIQPKLRVDDPIMKKSLRRFRPVTCKLKEEEWVHVSNGTVRYSASALKKYSNFTCYYQALKREGDYNISWAEPEIEITDGFVMTSDFFSVSCHTSTNKTFDGIFSGVAYTKERAERPEPPMHEGFEGMSVVIMGYDSMSRMSWLRRLVKTREYFHDKLGAIELEAHNIVGDGTTAVMFPMLTGKFEWELPEARLKYPNATVMDDFPFLWHDMRRAGYLTSWCNAAPKTAPFNWRMLGFSEQPTDFYTRPFYMAFEERVPLKLRSCLGSRSFSRMWLDYFRDIFMMYPNKRKFLFHFLVEMSHDDNNQLTKMDEDIKSLIQQLHSGGYLNNTLFILMGDHGARYSKVRSTYSGKLEERLPYFSFLFPQWFQEKYPQAIANLRTNTKRLTTPFDLFETFKDFLRFDGSGMGSVSNRGISLFKEIPLERSCEHAHIAPHWCACLAWKNVSMEEDGAKRALRYTLDTINSYTQSYRNECALLTLEKVTDATKLETRTEVLKFLKADDEGGIYKLNFNATNKNEMAMYQLTFYTTPGHGYFEVTVTHDLVRNKFTVNEKEISRINKYGDAPACILNKNRQIRQYCYCLSNIKS